MSQSLTVELNDETYEAIERQAEVQGDSPCRIAATALERQFHSAGSNGTAKETPRDADSSNSLRRLFGSVSLPSAVGLDNEQIDADLAREYGDPHETD